MSATPFAAAAIVTALDRAPRASAVPAPRIPVARAIHGTSVPPLLLPCLVHHGGLPA